MNYPVWYLPEIDGGALIALIAVTHVYVSHFAVEGGLYRICCYWLDALEGGDERQLREKYQFGV